MSIVLTGVQWEDPVLSQRPLATDPSVSLLMTQSQGVHTRKQLRSPFNLQLITWDTQHQFGSRQE
jgi:hypothetical protein